MDSQLNQGQIATEQVNGRQLLMNYMFMQFRPKWVQIWDADGSKDIRRVLGIMELDGNVKVLLSTSFESTQNEPIWRPIQGVRMVLKVPDESMISNPYLLLSRINDGYGVNLPIPGDLAYQAGYKNSYINPFEMGIAAPRKHF